jgi:putative flippase GtrA
MIRREIVIFLIVGSLTVLLDFLTYRGLVWSQLFGVDLSKAIGFLTGTVFAYFANRFWTFGHKSHMAGSVWRFIIVYTISLGANVQINAFALTWLVDTTASVQIAFLLATGTSTIMNFLGLKLFVFKSIPLSEKS